MNIVSYEKLKEILQELWNRIKEKFVEEIKFDITLDTATNKPKNTLIQKKEGQETNVIDHVVTEWQDLEHITKYKITNIFNEDLIIDNQYHNTAGGLANDNNWCRYTVPCKARDVISVVKKTHDSQLFTYLDSVGNTVTYGNVARKNVNGWEHYVANVPDEPSIEMVSINIHKPTNPLNSDSIMIYKGNEAPTAEYYPFADGRTVIIDGSKVALTFDPTGSNLKSLTTHEAIKELDGKIANAGGGTVTSVNGQAPNDQGEVTVGIADIQGLQDSLNNKVDRAEVGNSANLIPRLDNQGKLVDTIIPELAITKIVDVQGQQQALEQANNGTIQIGDSVRLTGEQNKVYQYNGTTQGDFGVRFVELSSGDATVKTINNEQPQNGNFQFELEETTNAIGLKVNNQTITSTPLATQVEIDNLKNLLSF